MLHVLVMAAVATSADAATPDEISPARTLRVWSYAAGPIDDADREAAQRIANGLLASADIVSDLRNCDRAGSCQPDSGRGPHVTLILSSGSRAKCGVASFDPDKPAATVIVSLPCVADVVFRLKHRLPTRSHPLLATLELHHLLGAVIAHEIAHVLGLRHAPTGLMRARLDVDDIVALRLGSLAFSKSEATRMRTSALWAGTLVRGANGRRIDIGPSAPLNVP